MLNFTSRSECIESPALLIKIFIESLSLQIPISGESKRVAGELSYLIDSDFRESKKIVAAFESILDSHYDKYNILDEMVWTGFLTGFIPEFQGIVNRI
jgi:UTP:GlnB (protein PII) uridylyltransferase